MNEDNNSDIVTIAYAIFMFIIMVGAVLLLYVVCRQFAATTRHANDTENGSNEAEYGDDTTTIASDKDPENIEEEDELTNTNELYGL